MDRKPAAVINCAAYTNVDGAEDEQETALDINAFAVRTLARATTELGAVLVHYSTDFVFAGTAATPYTEDDAPEPQSVYAQSKLLGEWIAADNPRHYVLRVESLFGGPNARSSVDRIAGAVRAGQPAPVFTDRVVSPSFVDDVVDATAYLLRSRSPAGLYHCVNTGFGTWLDVGREIARLLGQPETTLKPDVGARRQAARTAPAICGPEQRQAGPRRLCDAVVARRAAALHHPRERRVEPRSSWSSRSFARNAGAAGRAAARYPDATFTHSPSVLGGDELVQLTARPRRAPSSGSRGSTRPCCSRRCRSLRVISKYGVGLDGLDLEAIARRGIKLAWTGGVNRRAVARAHAGVCDCPSSSRARNERRAPRRPLHADGGPAVDRPDHRHHRVRPRREGSGAAAGAVRVPRPRPRHSRLPGVLRGAPGRAGAARSAPRRIRDRHDPRTRSMPRLVG